MAEKLGWRRVVGRGGVVVGVVCVERLRCRRTVEGGGEAMRLRWEAALVLGEPMPNIFFSALVDSLLMDWVLRCIVRGEGERGWGGS